MSQSNDTTNQTSTEATAPAEGATASKASAAGDLLSEVAGALKGSVSAVRETVVKTLVDKEKNNRVSILLKGLDKKAQLQNELKGIKPPSKKVFKLVDGKMQEVEATYTQDEVKKHNEETKAYNKKLKEATDKFNKFANLLDTALAGADPEKLEETYAKLAKAVGGGAVDDDEKKDEE